MKRVFVVCFFLAVSGACFAQTAKDPVTSAVREILPRQQKNLVGSLEGMPADKYGFKPTPAHQPFAHLAAHMIEANNILCSAIGGVAEPKGAQESDGKDKLVASLKTSFDFCQGVMSKATDANLGDEVSIFGGRKVSRAYAMFALTGGWADHYAAAAMYLRLNGVLPPSAQPKE